MCDFHFNTITIIKSFTFIYNYYNITVLPVPTRTNGQLVDQSVDQITNKGIYSTQFIFL